ncbi:MAG: hypothetical protein JWM32_90, partial [Verrucomicrobia bacterium]|nr:hypothetical protein [Verrucomicrobiota bacterium]
PGGIYIHWGFWQNAEPGAAENVARLITEMRGELITRTQSQAFKMAIFRIDTAGAFARLGSKVPVARPQTDLDFRLEAAKQEQAHPAAPAPAK